MTPAATEASVEFACFGGTVGAFVAGDGKVDGALAEIRRRLEGWHRRFTRFDSQSELSRLNADPAQQVHASNVMCRFAEAAIGAAAMTGGLVDPTLVGEIEAAGYRTDIATAVSLQVSLEMAPPRRAARPSAAGRWREIVVDRRHRTITRPPGVELDSGGIAKGLFADMLAEQLAAFDAFAIDCAGDIRIGGRGAIVRKVRVDDPLGRGCLHEFELAAGGVATSGIGRRSWVDDEGRPAHHLLDPSTGRPAFTGIIQATALAPTALEAEARAKAALLSGPCGAREWLRHGGALVFDDGSQLVHDPEQPLEEHLQRRAGAATLNHRSGPLAPLA